jgi:hypothetical protein
MHATYPAHLVPFDFIPVISDTNRKAAHYAIFYRLLLHPFPDTQIFPSAPCSYTNSILCFSVDVRHKVSHPCEQTKKIIVLYISQPVLTLTQDGNTKFLN